MNSLILNRLRIFPVGLVAVEAERYHVSRSSPQWPSKSEQFQTLQSSGDSRGWPGVARATPESSLATPVATQDLIGSWSSSSTQEIREMLSINDDS